MTVSNEVEDRAYHLWLRHYHHSEIDCKSDGPWLKDLRQAGFLTEQTIAEHLNIQQSTYSKMERNERIGKITIRDLKRIARIYNCDLRYQFVPKRTSFSKRIWNRLFFDVIKLIESARRPASAGQIANFARLLMYDTDYRRRIGWNQRGMTGESTTFKRINRTIVRRLSR